jgi:hypothetical protein
VHQLVQIAGALLILSGFVLAQLGALDPRSVWYLVVNLAGSAVLTVDAFHQEQWGFVLLELVWAIVSALGLVQLARGLRPSDEPVSDFSRTPSKRTERREVSD